MVYGELQCGDILHIPAVEHYHTEESWTNLVIDIRHRPECGTYKALDIDILNSSCRVITIGRPASTEIRPHLHVIRDGQHINAKSPRP
jgi:hypothetical protein